MEGELPMALQDKWEEWEMKNTTSFVALAASLGLVITSAGCATIVRGTSHGIGISSQPPGAKVTINNQEYGRTPVSAKLRRKDNHHVVIQLEGYEPYEIVLTRQTSAWLAGNLVFGLGFPIGIAIDAIAGGMYSLNPDQIEAELRPDGPKVVSEDGSIMVILVPEANPAWEKIGQLQPARPCLAQ
jgi:hypothetical protein